MKILVGTKGSRPLPPSLPAFLCPDLDDSCIGPTKEDEHEEGGGPGGYTGGFCVASGCHIALLEGCILGGGECGEGGRKEGREGGVE